MTDPLETVKRMFGSIIGPIPCKNLFLFVEFTREINGKDVKITAKISQEKKIISLTVDGMDLFDDIFDELVSQENRKVSGNG